MTHNYASAPSKVLLEGDVVAVVEMFLNDGYEACQQSKGEFTTRSNPRISGFKTPLNGPYFPNSRLDPSLKIGISNFQKFS